MSANYYQVATPKSPHDLLNSEDDQNNHEIRGGEGVLSSTLDNNNSLPSRLNSGLLRSAGDSEDAERLKYEVAKSELLDKLNLQIAMNHKQIENIKKELKKTDGRMTLLNSLHDDEKLKDKIEEYTKAKCEQAKRELEMEKARQSMGYNMDTSSLSYVPGSRPSISAGSSTSGHHYHTRSKSNSHLLEFSNLRPLDSNLPNQTSRLPSKGLQDNTSSKDIIPGGNANFSFTTTFNPTQLYAHHKRNYSSTCLTSNSGVVGKNENNEAIFRRYDGILIIIKCSFCDRSGFTSAQGIVNHCRLKHSKTYNSQPLAVLNNQTLLPEEKQDADVLNEFKKQKVDPAKEYLPSIKNSILNPEKRTPSPKQNNQQKHVTIDSIDPKHTKHLEKLYSGRNNDFKDLIDMVKEAPKDLQVVLDVSSDPDDEDEEDTESNGLDLDIPSAERSEDEKSYTPSNASDQGSSPNSIVTPNEANFPKSPVDEQPRRNLRKRKDMGEDEESEKLFTRRVLRERLRPAEKKARADVIALTELPPEEKRSSHYNLRAKSKLRSSSGSLDLE